MTRFVLHRLLLTIPALFGLFVLTFIMMRVLPNDPSAALAGENATPAQIAAVRKAYGFDEPLWKQFVIYVEQVAHGDLGNSIISNRPVLRDISDRLPATIELTFVSLAFAASPAFAVTEIQWWHAMTGPNNDVVVKLANDFNASQSEYKIVPSFKGSYADTLNAGIAASVVLYEASRQRKR